MTAITFPNNPSSGDTHTAGNGIVYTYDGEKWTSIGTNSAGTWTRSGTEVSLTNAGDDLNVDSGTLFVDASTDRVGVGTSSPSQLLHIAATGDPQLLIEATGTSASDDAQLALKTTNGEFLIQNDRSLGTSGVLTFNGNTTDNLCIDHATGRVGIGTTSPANTLHIAGSSATLRIEDTDTNAYSIINTDNGGSLYLSADAANSQASSSVRLLVDGTEHVRLDSSGRLLVGTSSTSGPAAGAVTAAGGIFSTERTTGTISNGGSISVTVPTRGAGACYLVAASRRQNTTDNHQGLYLVHYASNGTPQTVITLNALGGMTLSAATDQITLTNGLGFNTAATLSAVRIG